MIFIGQFVAGDLSARHGDPAPYKKYKRYDSRGFLAPMSTEVEVLVYFLW